MWILRYGSILNKPRNFICNKFSIIKELFNCSLCLGFWCGLFIGGLFYNIEQELYYFTFPFASAAICWFFDSLLDLIQLGANKLDKK